MRFSVACWVLVFAAVGLAGAPQGSPKLLSKDHILELVRGSVPSDRLVTLIKEQGVDFEPTGVYLRSLRSAGASQAVIDAVFAASPTQQRLKAANVLLDKGDVDGAIGEYREVLRVNPGNPDVHRLLGVALGKRGDWQGDLAEQRMALRLRPSDALAKAELISVLKGAGGAELAQLEIVTTPQAEVYLGNKLEGRVGGDGHIRVLAKPGLYALRVSHEGKQDFRQDVTLATGQVTRIAAVLANSGPTPGTAKENPKAR